MKSSVLACFVCVLANFYVECNSEVEFRKYTDYFDDQFDSLESFQGYQPREQTFRYVSSEEITKYCPNGVKCVPPIQCPAHVNLRSNEKPQKCRLSSKKWGYCCLTGYNLTASRPDKYRNHQLRNGAMLREIITEVKNIAERMISHRSHSLRTDNPDFLHHLTFQLTNRNHQRDGKVSKWALEQILTGQLIREREQMLPEEVFELTDVRDENSVCLQPPKCKNTQLKYRTADGNCNNPLPDRSFWGAAGQPMERLLLPAYEDGIWAPRQHSVDGSLLTSPRTVSRILFPDFDRPHSFINLLFMQFGQFTTHDFTQSSSIQNDDGQPIQCCKDDGSSVLPPEEMHFACMPIEVDPDDEFYGPFNQGCINFVRLSLAPYFNCRIGFGKQISKVTHFLDASGVYGSSLEVQGLLRSFQDGKLKVFPRVNGDMLPITTRNQSCGGTSEGKICYLSGDGRTNQIISLTLLHTMFAREHNRIASILARINPHYSDELLFQEARRVLIAEMQHIIYAEYLPLLVGRSAMERFRLYPEKNGYTVDYDPNINPAIRNEFSGAAFRFGHSTVDGHFKVESKGNVEEKIEIPDVMFDPERLEQEGFPGALMQTLLVQNMQKADHSVTRGLSVFMFRGSNPFGVDLVATNIQRGRDQGIRSYNDYLELIGRKRIESFDEFGPMASRLRLVYRHPDDVDLWVGGLLEDPFQDAVVGQLFVEIIAEQFSRFKRGDRYFYSNHPKINPGYLTPCQLREIRKVTLARIICDNIEPIVNIQPFAFLTGEFPGNQPVKCQNIPKVDFSCWKS